MIELEKEDRIISDFLHAIGPWYGHIVIGGGYAPIIYKLYLADKKLEFLPVGTRDIDSLISRKVPLVSEKTIAKHLDEAAFTQVFRGMGIPATEAYIKEIDGVEVEIEFLTDAAARVGKDKNVIISGVVAQPLSYLSLSLQKTMAFRTYSEKEGRVVSPAAWIFHKGLTFTRRKKGSKVYKDLYGIWYVATQLGDFSEKALLEFSVLGQHHPKWVKTFQKNLQSWLKNASPLDWLKLEMQDTYGRLKRLGFEKVVEKMS